MFSFDGRGVSFAEGYLEIGFGIFDPEKIFPDLSPYGPSNWANWGAEGQVNE
jgi:hypothetical protein